MEMMGRAVYDVSVGFVETHCNQRSFAQWQIASVHGVDLCFSLSPSFCLTGWSRLLAAAFGIVAGIVVHQLCPFMLRP